MVNLQIVLAAGVLMIFLFFMSKIGDEFEKVEVDPKAWTVFGRCLSRAAG